MPGGLNAPSPEPVHGSNAGWNNLGKKIAFQSGP